MSAGTPTSISNGIKKLAREPFFSKMYNYMDVIVQALMDELAAFFEKKGSLAFLMALEILSTKKAP
jgi:hypothetical protein